MPGPHALEVKQKADGLESDWSEPHRFTVKELLRTPEIDAPTPGSFNPRKPTIRGKGETRGQILLRHEDAPENLIDTLDGVASWRWTAKDPWDVGQYTIQAQQTDDDESSSWSEPRTFEVIDARYGIGDAGPVLAQPVVSNHESVLLRVQVLSGITGEAVEGVKVEWRIAGEQAAMTTSVTGPDGWAHYLYTPDTAGEHSVLADLTGENQGVEITQRFEVSALPDDAWARRRPVFRYLCPGIRWQPGVSLHRCDAYPERPAQGAQLVAWQGRDTGIERRSDRSRSNREPCPGYPPTVRVGRRELVAGLRQQQ
ncbi:Ig-like domain-containing protein [Pseudomonas sp. MWU13-2105]|uniref:Ig-like domain-containing protein n=1 Tax=Pseudomonas sp. MWU13-2105 TaxID=2935074 RepID=UPI00200E9CA6|nr:Ig-like domain-containing protein [Pseudomonas sp. MWU13-2105]